MSHDAHLKTDRATDTPTGTQLTGTHVTTHGEYETPQAPVRAVYGALRVTLPTALRTGSGGCIGRYTTLTRRAGATARTLSGGGERLCETARGRYDESEPSIQPLIEPADALRRHHGAQARYVALMASVRWPWTPGRGTETRNLGPEAPGDPPSSVPHRIVRPGGVSESPDGGHPESSEPSDKRDRTMKHTRSNPVGEFRENRTTASPRISPENLSELGGPPCTPASGPFQARSGGFAA